MTERTADEPSDLDEVAGTILQGIDGFSLFLGSDAAEILRQMVATITPQLWSAQPATLLSRMETIIGDAASGRSDPSDRSTAACVLQFLRGLRKVSKFAQADPLTLGSDVGRALLDFMRERLSALGPDAFFKAVLATPGIRRTQFLTGFVHLCAAGEPRKDGVGLEECLRTRARTLSEGTELVTKVLWIALGRLSAEADEPPPNANSLGGARHDLKQLWLALPSARQSMLLTLLDRDILTVRNAVGHAAVDYRPEFQDAVFPDDGAETSIRLSELELQKLAESHTRACFTVALGAVTVVLEEVLRQLSARRWKLDRSQPLIGPPPKAG